MVESRRVDHDRVTYVLATHACTASSVCEVRHCSNEQYVHGMMSLASNEGSRRSEAQSVSEFPDREHSRQC
jgi:hypothetical protein